MYKVSVNGLCVFARAHAYVCISARAYNLCTSVYECMNVCVCASVRVCNSVVYVCVRALIVHVLARASVRA